MSRRSTRLLSGGYYHSDEESDSSSVTTISYRENPVKVFKKKSGGRKKRSEPDVGPVSSRASLEGTPEAPPSDWSPVSRPALRSPIYASPSTPGATRSKPVLHFQLQSDPAQSTVDSSGYSSSEGPQRNPSSSSSSSSSSSGPGKCAGAREASREWFTNTVSRLKDMMTGAVAVGRSSRVVQLACSSWPFTAAAGVRCVTANSWSSARMKKLCGLLLLLLLLLLLGAWWTSRLSGLSIRTGPSLILPPAQPYSDAQPNALDVAAVSAAVEAKVQLIQREMRLKHVLLLAELKQQVQLDLQVLRQKSQEKEQEQEQEQKQKKQEKQEKWEKKQEEQKKEQEKQEQRLSELVSTLQQFQAHSESAAASLLLRLTALEEQVSKMEQREDPLPGPSPLLSQELKQALDVWLSRRLQDQAAAVHTGDSGTCGTCVRPLADKMADFALESQGASVVSTRCSETYRTRSACVSLFGLPLWYPSESPRTVIQGPAVLLPGKCWAFHGVQGTLVIALSHPIRISHVSLDHLPRHSSPTGRIDSAPKDFQVYGMTNETEQGTLLGTFRYNEDGEPTQTFSLSGLTDVVYHVVELRVLSNWGHVQYTCVYRFRVHGQLAST